MTEQAKHHTLHPDVEIQQLVPQRGTRDVQLSPESEVLCINRGAAPLEDMWDSIPFLIPPGYFKTTYAAARHFRDRAVVPGSRNPETHRQTSFIAIIGIVDYVQDGFKVVKPVDDPSEWEVFNASERAEYEDEPEALDRDGMVNPIDRDVQIVSTSSVVAGRPGNKNSRIKGGKGTVNTRPAGGSGIGAGMKTDVQVTDPSIFQPIPAEDNPVVREARSATAQAAAEGHKPR